MTPRAAGRGNLTHAAPSFKIQQGLQRGCQRVAGQLLGSPGSTSVPSVPQCARESLRLQASACIRRPPASRRAHLVRAAAVDVARGDARRPAQHLPSRFNKASYENDGGVAGPLWCRRRCRPRRAVSLSVRVGTLALRPRHAFVVRGPTSALISPPELPSPLLRDGAWRPRPLQHLRDSARRS